ncbi:motile sperm domain-containing protein 1-like [Limulus polyphemus]|uniref:Motile sperm domain-containing protein 1-like n=1 Tax=Limulus polyphemus TaxID=6850 RepID=A0ABM1SXD7_LIMPO|nr:motile sperm domain-containing protein 1-like [Limulus polyphemus]
MQSPSLIDGKLPIFSFPSSLTFYADDQSSHKQILTLYNPYDFPLKFRGICLIFFLLNFLKLADDNVSNVDMLPEVDDEYWQLSDLSCQRIGDGCCKPFAFPCVSSLKERMRYDYFTRTLNNTYFLLTSVIRHNGITQSNCGITDKFRIQVQEHGQRQVLGKKDIPATVLLSKPDNSASSTVESEQFEQLSKQSLPLMQARQYAINGAQGRSNSGPSVVVILAAIVCILALILPTRGDPEGFLPVYLHLSMHQKLIAAYTLGLVTMVIFRT